MKRPGVRLRALAAHVFDAETMNRLIDPVIADLQIEYAAASNAGLIWRRRWVRGVGYAAFLYVALWTLRVFFALTLAFTVLFELPGLSHSSFTLTRALYLVPQGLVVAVPIALTLATAWASRPTSRSRRALTAAIAAGAVCSLLAFVTIGWWLPAANQAFRVSVARENGFRSGLIPGVGEMTMGELRDQMKWARAVRADWKALEYTYYSRWAFPCASLSLGLFVFSVRRRGLGRRFMLFAGVPIILGYYALMFFSREYSLRYVLSPMVGAWIPNVLTLLAAVAIAIRATPRQVVA